LKAIFVDNDRQPIRLHSVPPTQLQSGQGARDLLEALQQAARRWGEKAYIRELPTESNRFRVGLQNGGLFRVKGAGRTREEAFEAADRDGKNLA